MSKKEDKVTPVYKEMTHNKAPVGEKDFWRKRIYESVATGKMLHQIIFDDSYDLWCYIQSRFSGILARHITKGSRVLDAGCGYGAVLSCFEEAGYKPEDINYTGVDFSPDLIELARYRYPENANRQFLCLDLASLPYPNNYFDWVIVRSVEGMIVENLGKDFWDVRLNELRRVGGYLLLSSYPENVDKKYLYQIEINRVRKHFHM